MLLEPTQGRIGRDRTNARARLGWRPRVGLAELVREMVAADLAAARGSPVGPGGAG